MRQIRNFTLFVTLMWAVGACLKQPESSVIPQIQIQDLVFKNEFLTNGKFDTLILTLKFTDGDGDLGIDGNETAIYRSPTDSTDINTPYYFGYDTAKTTTWGYTHNKNITLPKGYKWVNYASHRTIHSHPFDTLPSTLTCKYWEVRSNPIDTLYIQPNPYNNNIYVDIYIKDANGNYTYFDPTTVYPFGSLCTPNFFNSRFPVLSSDAGKKSSLSGTITYKIQSAGLCIRLCNKTIKVKTYILDRAFHKSNIAESEDFLVK